MSKSIDVSRGMGRGSDPVVRPLPDYMRHWWLVALALAAAAAVPLWLIRNVLSDQIAYGAAEEAGTESAYQLYLTHGWLHTGAAEQKIAEAALQDARRLGTTQAFRGVVTRYPGAPVATEARAEIHKLYEKSLDAYRPHAGPDARVRKFMESLFRYFEEHDTGALEVRFIRPPNSALEADDRRLQGRASILGRRMAAITPHFSPESAAAREQSLLRRLNTAFGAVVPPDVMSLVPGEPLEASSATSDKPLVLIEYGVIPSGDFYEAESSALFVGIRIPFDVSMLLPESPPLNFRWEVEPPERFGDASTLMTRLPDSGPPEGRVYGVMAERAFDELSEKLQSVFFARDPRTGSAAAGAR
jgi:hypothetical protein